MELFLERSCANPLDIVIEFDERLCEAASDLIMLREQLLHVVHRCRRLYVVGATVDDLFVVLHPLQELRAPLLELLEVRDLENPYDDTDLSFRIFEGGAPKLTHLAIQGVDLPSCRPPTSSLIFLHLDPRELFEFDEYQEAFDEASNLTHLQLSGSEWFSDLSSHELKIPSLRSLMVLTGSALSFDDLFYFLAYLEVPNLVHLTLHCTFLARYQPDCTGLSPQYRHLVSLNLHCSASARAWEAGCLAWMFPSITHLTLKVDVYGSFEELLRCLIPGDFDPCVEEDWGLQEIDLLLWPRLRVISLSFVYWKDLDALRDVILSRISCGVPVECVQLADLDDIPVETLEWLREIVTVEEFKVSELECCEDTTKKMGTFVSASYSTVAVSTH
jgi:hypothetical protein